MASIEEKIQAEIENINKVLAELEKVKDRHNKELVVLVGQKVYSEFRREIETTLKTMVNDPFTP